MHVSERVIVERLFDEAAKRGFVPVRFAAQPGEPQDAIEATDSAYLTLDACLAFAREWDADSIVEFAHESGGRGFWVLLIWGNHEDVISDYQNTADANAIIDPVYAWINDGPSF